MYVIGNPVREAGLGGFEWRDRTIVEQINASDLKKKALLTKILIYALFLIPALAFSLMMGIFGALLSVIVVSFFIFAKIDKMNKYCPALLGVATLVCLNIGVRFETVGFSLLVLLGIGLVTLVARKEVLALGSILIASTVALPAPFDIIVLVTSIVFTLFMSVRSRQNELSQFALHNSKKWSALDESPSLPLGYQKLGLALLKKELKTNSGHVSARHRGSMAERKTAIAFMGLPSGSFVFHDILLPGADSANIDHLVVTPQGIFVVDTKLFSGFIKDKGNGDLIKVSGSTEQSLYPITKQMLWAKVAMEKTLMSKVQDIQVKPLVVVHRAEMRHIFEGGKGKEEKVAYVPFDRALQHIANSPQIYDRNALKQLANVLKEVLKERKPVYVKN